MKKKELIRMGVFFIVSTFLGVLYMVFLSKATGRNVDLFAMTISTMIVSIPCTFFMNQMIKNNTQ